jgi:VIT1/CCC1 family predicted Fe2+/Mn2+ transporter
MFRIIDRVRSSLHASAGDIVFGMEDGAVSVFGLVFGVAATTDQSIHVLVAGVTGAFAHSVSMMAGTFLERQSEQDQRRVRLEELRAQQADEPQRVAADIEARLKGVGLEAATVARFIDEARGRPGGLQALAEATLMPRASAGRSDHPAAHAAWMLGSDMFASLLPVLPFALLPMLPARLASVVFTAGLMVALGVWRAKLGRRPTKSTVYTTLGIAAAAGIVGLVIGQAVNAWFGVN